MIKQLTTWQCPQDL